MKLKYFLRHTGVACVLTSLALGFTILPAANAQSPFKNQPSNQPGSAAQNLPTVPNIPGIPGISSTPNQPRQAGAPPAVTGPGGPAGPGAQAATAADVSGVARQMYEQARTKLLQIRVVAKGRTTQTGVGSGFYVTSDGLIMTNFHVISRVALGPDKYQALYLSADGQQGELNLLAFDIRNDLALLRPTKAVEGLKFFSFRPPSVELNRGERIFSMGNPLDIGFAVVEGTFNGLLERSFYPQIFFSGAINPGMSGGPAIDEQGRIVGINVAKRLDGDSVGFLVPASKGVALIERQVAMAAKQTVKSEDPKPVDAKVTDTKVADAKVTDAKGIEPKADKSGFIEVTKQLQAHQADLVERFMKEPFRPQTYGPYRIPLPQETFFRCWGADEKSSGYFKFERTDCRMDSRVFTGQINTGFFSLRHEVYDGRGLHPARYAAMFGQSFRNEAFVLVKNGVRTLSQCEEKTIDQAGLILRAVVCLSALKKHIGLYDLNILVGSMNENQAGLLARFDAGAVSYENSQRLLTKYLEGFSWQPAR